MPINNAAPYWKMGYINVGGAALFADFEYLWSSDHQHMIGEVFRDTSNNKWAWAAFSLRPHNTVEGKAETRELAKANVIAALAGI
jgi:hypothetical protein